MENLRFVLLDSEWGRWECIVCLAHTEPMRVHSDDVIYDWTCFCYWYQDSDDNEYPDSGYYSDGVQDMYFWES